MKKNKRIIISLVCLIFALTASSLFLLAENRKLGHQIEALIREKKFNFELLDSYFYIDNNLVTLRYDIQFSDQIGIEYCEISIFNKDIDKMTSTNKITYSEDTDNTFIIEVELYPDKTKNIDIDSFYETICSNPDTISLYIVRNDGMEIGVATNTPKLFDPSL